MDNTKKDDVPSDGPPPSSDKEENSTSPTSGSAKKERASAGTTAPTNTGAERSRRVYVGNLPWSISWQDLKDHMKSQGLDVVRANIMSTPDGRSKGCGIVELATVEDAQKAVLTMNDSELGGRQIFVREDREDRTHGAAAHAATQPSTANANEVTPPAVASSAVAGADTTASGAEGTSVGTAPADSANNETAKSRRVYVGNLSWDVAWQDLKDHMRQAGEVVHAEIITERTGRSKGCGIVEYANEQEAQAAIVTLTDTDLKGRMIFVREDREVTSQAGASAPRWHSTSVYVGNLTKETSWQDLKDHMRLAGNVDSVTVLTNTTGESIGCAIVHYQRAQDAARAIRELQDSELHGSTIFVREDRSHRPSGGGAGGGGGRGFRRGGGGRGRGGYGYGGGGGGGYEGRGAAVSQNDGTQLFVSNLAYRTTWRELKDHFRQCGEVTHAEVKTLPNGNSKGCGTVQFSNKTEAEEAIQRLNGSELQGRNIDVRPDQKRF